MPRFVRKPHNCVVPEGKTASFKCKVLASSPPVITWYVCTAHCSLHAEINVDDDDDGGGGGGGGGDIQKRLLSTETISEYLSLKYCKKILPVA